MKKKWMTLLLAATLVFGSVPTVAFGSEFADIDSAPWEAAKDYIDEARNLSLMNGYLENGVRYCKPTNSVTYSETVQLIYSIMKEAGEVSISSTQSSKWEQVLSAYNIDAWVQPAATYALEEGIISSAELTYLRDDVAADREAVGVIYGKALATVDDIDSSATLVYNDKSSISASSVPYLDLLYDWNVMVGDTDNNFNPAADINRAEMAVLSVRTYNALTGSSFSSSSKTAEGTVTSYMELDSGSIFMTLTTSSGSGLTLSGDDDIDVTYEGESMTTSDIGVGDTVSIKYSGTTLKSVEILDSVAGIYLKVYAELEDIDDDEIETSEGTYDLSDDVTVKVNGSKSTVSKLEDYLDDYYYDVTLSFDSSGDVITVLAVLNDNNKLTGQLVYIGSSDITIKYNSKEYEYPLDDDDVDVEYNGNSKTFSSLENDIDDGYYYEVTLSLSNAGEVNAIEINYLEDETNGVLTFMNSRRIELEANGDTYTYYIDDEDIDVEIDGKSADLDDLKDMYDDDYELRISVDVDRDDNLEEVWAWTDSSAEAEGELVSVSSSKIVIEVDGDDYSYSLSDDLDIEIDGTSISLTTFKSAASDYEYDVELAFDSSGDVKEIIGTNQDPTYGELRDIREDDYVKITAGGVNYTYDLYSSLTIKLEGKTADIDDLDDAIDDAFWTDEYIYVELGFKSSKVNEIDAEYKDEEDDDDDDDAEYVLSGELTKISSSYKTVTVDLGYATISYTLEDYEDTDVDLDDDSSVKDVADLDDYMDDDLSSGDGIWVSIYLNDDYEVYYIDAEVMDDDDIEDELPCGEGILKDIGSNWIKVKDDQNGSTYIYYLMEDPDDVEVSYDNVSKSYDEDDYDDDMDGLEDFFDDCDDEGDDCYVELSFDKYGLVDEIEAYDD
ncbi:S-layer homology domain-containing protein [Chakrabartyella piscis]|uniref:S-layer homology domain-containing protein n=1 Tax=Chakrabartyella piscis TaxID=2918914 RepID=UPI0029588070|nr:S-layer homology domain-containing protein [Chakrabartyella piscis]